MLYDEYATHRHYKGGLYRVLYIDVHDANNGHEYDQLSVIYQSLKTGDISMRYQKEFFDYVTLPDGSEIRRFEPLNKHINTIKGVLSISESHHLIWDSTKGYWRPMTIATEAKNEN